jgi:hypothetical protein
MPGLNCTLSSGFWNHLQCRETSLRLHIQRQGDYHIDLRETADFLKADLRRDPTAALARAEGEQR